MSLLNDLRDLVRPDAIITEPRELEGFTEDWRGRYHGPAACVVRPGSTEEVAAVVAACACHGVPILPQGGKTSLCGGAIPAEDGPAPVIINLDRMRRIRSVDPVTNAMVVEAGAILATVQQAARDAGRYYPVSLGAEGSCQIGGTIATNAGGTSVLRYGNTRDNVLGLEAVLPDGTIWSSLKGLRKDNTGYDLKHLLIGSEGTLGVITAACLKLHPLPSRSSVAWLAVAGVNAALELLGRFQEGGAGRLSGFELMNRLQHDLVMTKVPDRRSPLEGQHDWHLLIELSDAGGPDDLNAVMEDLLAPAFEDGLVLDAVIAASDAQRATLWEIRHSVSEANKKGGMGLTTDCAVPISAIAAFIAEASDAVHAIVPELPIIIVAHLGDGNVHFIPFFPFEGWTGPDAGEGRGAQVRQAVNDIAIRLGGTFSAEHGVGRVSLAEMARYKPASELRLMWAVKNALDPAGLMNPGRLLPPPA
ncbi:D-2-hydroxyacid dehydrogenase [Agaricicola taiwanensis]|uniref:D-2-hydroxyacid dehydrogenase n=1 Tax=Agaricicola taiwanensis TaxID=591372 RepID=A0A8J2VLZ9_9RHOB|nr:FAD-binding oxidoreductase [Agaricicola taiwanensis]GGE29078.1 D-2-hydroxyacid dehydrogenase [Agaricicola taiwanensis]